METSEIKEIWESLPSEKKSEIIRLFCNRMNLNDFDYESSITNYKESLQSNSFGHGAVYITQPCKLYLEVDVIDPILTNTFTSWMFGSYVTGDKVNNKDIPPPFAGSVIKQISRKPLYNISEKDKYDITTFINSVNSNEFVATYSNGNDIINNVINILNSLL